MGKTYGHYCALARALDLVGDRWTLLIVRELLVAPATYGQLLAGLPGIATNLLAQRLRQLKDDGLIRRAKGTGSGSSRRYELTPRGRSLDDVVTALIRWGAPEMARGASGDAFRPGWLVVALRALSRPGDIDGSLAFAVQGETVTVDVRRGDVSVGRDAPPAIITIETDPETALALASGLVRLPDAVALGHAQVQGSVQQGRRLLRALRGARTAPTS